MKLSLHYPVKPYIKYQSFGESMACVEKESTLPVAQRKVVTKVSYGGSPFVCPVGYTDLYPLLGMKGHTGEDMFGAHGTPIYATHDGWVHELQSEAERGLGIGLISNDTYELQSGVYHIKTRYWHLKSMNIDFDSVVKTGDLIGWADNTGLSSGDHLHFELKPVEKNSKGKWYNVFQDNGYFGAIDPTPYWSGLYAEHAKIPPKYVFNTNLMYGDTGYEVSQLQSKLLSLGYKIPSIESGKTQKGYYGSETRAAVFSFQQDYVAKKSWMAWIAVWANWGTYCYELTRNELNRL